MLVLDALFFSLVQRFGLAWEGALEVLVLDALFFSLVQRFGLAWEGALQGPSKPEAPAREPGPQVRVMRRHCRWFAWLACPVSSILLVMNHWLIKSEPDVFSIHDLAKAKRRTTHWEGVRNYQARNFLRAMRVGDRALYYHSNATPSAVAGVVEIVRTAYPDPTAWDPTSDYHDPKASPENPIWAMVDVRLVEIFPREIPLDELRTVKALAGMELLRRGSRLSVQPVTAAQFRTVEKLSQRPG